MTSSPESRQAVDYEIRQYESGDRDGFLELYERVFGEGGTPEWFAWKYETNPYLSDPPIFVAEHDGQVVGTRPFLGFRMAVGDRTCIALQTGDTMVHPDHRRQGLFTRMTERAFDYYGERDPAFTFNVPNPLSRPGYLKLGCDIVAPLTTYYRVQKPSTFLDADGVTGRLGPLLEPVTRSYLKVKDVLADDTTAVDVVRHDEIPVDELARLYRQHPPDAIHAPRDERFLEYRFGNPQWKYTAYTARVGGEPVAGVVTGTQSNGDETLTNVTDVVPLTGGGKRRRGLSALLARVLDDHADSNVVAVRGTAIPDDLLSRYGFFSDQSPPLSLVASPTVLITCPLPVDGDWRVGEYNLREKSNWQPTFVEQNTG